MKSFRLVVHHKSFSDDDLVINQKDYPEARKNDIVEIFHPPPQDEENYEEEFPHLLLQITGFKDDLVPSRTVSVEQSVAQAFGLKNYKNVTVRLVDPKDVALDSIEVTFKDQYMGRSEMWRFKNSLVNSCVYINKKLEFCGGSVRCQVYEMWALGERVACGVITEDTKIVFRSSTAMVYIFLQMSSEMWDFDNYGDLYFEKAVNGFLSDLFMKWKKNGSNHEVTIVMFSRTFYEANSLEEFPPHMRECLQKDYKGRYYEDFYRVPVQNERYDDWSNVLVQLRRIFQEYLNVVLKYHARANITIPAATNSTAAQGNFLEVLNMSLNVFEKHYLDRSFDRTGQLSVVVTPGVGVFEVDRELTNITKQRIIDGGVGSDLVCVGEQPLHAVPLLKFHNKNTHPNVPDDYSMPHWINLSFYSTSKKIPYSNFVPRIKLPPVLKDAAIKGGKETAKRELLGEDDCIHSNFFDYDAYDAAVFQLPNAHYVQEHSSIYGKVPNRHKRSSGSLLDSQELIKGTRRKMSDPDLFQRKSDPKRTEPIAIPSATTNLLISPHTEDKEFSPPMRKVVGSAGSPPHESRALINPFDPSHVTIKLTSNRRRWTHIFPKGPTGMLIQQHHSQAVPARDNEQNGCEQLNFQQQNKSLVVTAALQEYCKKRPSHTSNSTNSNKHSTKSLTLLWGATGEQEWTPALTTVNDVIIGVDWKSLTIPACLPITTDYFPDKRTLNTDYFESLYTLVPDSFYADFAQCKGTKKPMTTDEVFRELISQRLSQGFQLILNPKIKEKTLSAQSSNILRKSPTDNDESYFLSIGRLFHKISLIGNTISVTRYRPRHSYPSFKIQYRYRFHPPLHDTYEESYATFTTEKLETFNWNYLDHYVCTGGDTTEFELDDALKYWRFRVYLLPLNSSETKKIVEVSSRCDIYPLPTAQDHNQMTEGFLKFIETAVNKLKRNTVVSKKPRMSLSVQTLPPLAQPRRNSISSFSQTSTTQRSNERFVATNFRSGSKVLDRSRMSQGSQDQPGENPDPATEEGAVVAMTPLKPTATNSEIIEALKQQYNGLSFIYMPQSLPKETFVTADAVNWLLAHMEGVNTIEHAIKVMKGLHKDNLIRHASGDPNKPFIYGFFLFYIVPDRCEKGTNEKWPDRILNLMILDDKDWFQPIGDLERFENEFLEVEIKPALKWGLSTGTDVNNVPIQGFPTVSEEKEAGVPHFLCDNIDSDYADIDSDGVIYKKTRLETDVMNKSDRVEWGHCRYQTIFRPDQAYELIAEWLTSSGSIVGELLFGWHRKGQTSCSLQMIPIPHDPLALPYSNKSDPLRGPIFVPLNISCLENEDGPLFKDFPEDTWMDRMFLFKEAIVQRFGFIKCLIEFPSNQPQRPSREHQYIHATGTIFLLINCSAPKPEKGKPIDNKRLNAMTKYSLHAGFMPSPHEAYITRHVSGQNKADYDNSRKLGFLWCWNHMISRKWRTNQGVDSNFQIKVLKDFKAFCSNSENRLRDFWRESWNAKTTSLL
ncbi:GATOR complex protein Iml1 isoform X3 [Anthonomus grandis grandis]|uniref:GATOR complex protein Iml1 isoform X3 n=1 Tax=Anthonomus grandis grandis TaxID=2921223 RepID=UPI0021658AE2|nr:GATOR complex protein Iml1 isoform X3 [Anthonomus grandis grandis]